MKKSITLILVFLTPLIALGQTKHLTLESNHSTIGFVIDIAKGATKVTGKFTEADLKLTYVDADWTKSKVDFTIQVASINTGIPDRDNHLRTADFFDAEAFPTITFQSTSISSKGGNKYEMTGLFTMHGISASKTIPFEVTYNEGNTLGIHIESEVDRIFHKVGHEFIHDSIEQFISDKIKVEIDFWTKSDKRFPKE